MEKITFATKKRQNKKNNQLRAEGLIPANMYQAQKESIALEIEKNSFFKLSKNLSDNAIIYLQIEGEKGEFPVLIDDVQYDVYGKGIYHVVFRKVNLSEKITAEVSIEVVGEFKVDGAVFVLAKDSVEIEALPTDIPENFVIDQSKLTAIGDRITLDSLEFDRSKVSLVLSEDEKPEEIVVALAQEKVEEVEEEQSTDLVEPELVGGKKEDAADAEASTESAS